MLSATFNTSSSLLRFLPPLSQKKKKYYGQALKRSCLIEKLMVLVSGEVILLCWCIYILCVCMYVCMYVCIGFLGPHL